MGFNIKYFKDDVDHKFICSHCHGVFVDPVLCSCEHIYCWACFKRRKKRNKSCLICSAELEVSGEILASEWTKELHSLQVTCTKDCASEMTVGELNEHFEKECPYAMTTCSYKGCDKKTRRIDMTEHQEKCDYRVVACCCGVKMRFLDIHAHEVAQKCAMKQNLQSIVKKRREMENIIREHRIDIQKQAFQVDFEQRRMEKWKTNNRLALMSQNRATTSQSTRSAPNLCSEDEKATHSGLPTCYSAPVSTHCKKGKLKTCIQCTKLFYLTRNHDKACCWHQGPVANVFGGMCQACGNLTNTKGCTVGHHVARMHQRLPRSIPNAGKAIVKHSDDIER